MPRKADWQAAFAICAAVIGAGFASGREIVSFFSGLGAASWIGILSAASGIAALVYVIMLLARRTGAGSLPGLYGAVMGRSCQDAVGILHGLLCMTAASAMLSAGAELGALAFPVRHARGLGFLLTLCAGLASCAAGFGTLAYLGGLLVPGIGIYYLAMAAGNTYPVEFDASALPAAVPLGLLYAAFNTALSGSAICIAGSGGGCSAGGTALAAGGVMLLLLSAANQAMLSAGDIVRQAALPSVVLAARWGVEGYYLSILIMWLSVLTTLCALLHSLCAQCSSVRFSRTKALLSAGLAASLFSVCGFETLVDTAYPILGWISGLVLIALTAFLPDRDEQKKTTPSSA